MPKVINDNPFVFMGGTFDPIHNGHLRTALELQQWLGVDQIALIPAETPVHREAPGRTSEQRLEMVRLAVADEPALRVDDREICSDQPSYSLLTLQSLRKELGDERPICMIMGMDAYQTLPSWHEWEKFIDLCHLIVVQRPGYKLPDGDQISDFTLQHRVATPQDVLTKPAGSVLFHELTPLAISATQIRQTIEKGLSPRYLLPDQVWRYIQANRLYSQVS